MINRKSQFANRQSASGFTLLEMLIVIGILLILIGVAVPVVGKVRKAAQAANTRQMIARLEAGIQQYYDNFQSYPGPFFNAQLKPFAAAAPYRDPTAGPPDDQLHFAPTAGAPVLGQALTSSEHLYVALAGGLSYSPTGPDPQFTAKQTLMENANGPMSLAAANIKKFPTMISVTPDETTIKVTNPNATSLPPGKWNADKAPFVGDTEIPEFVDKFSTPSPILYMRANRGTAYFYSGQTSYNAHDAATQYQVLQVHHTYAGALQKQEEPWLIDTNDFKPEPADTVIATVGGVPQTVGALPGAFSYYGNPNVTGVQPLQKDGYILISAGPDGLYGTTDDITNFRNK